MYLSYGISLSSQSLIVRHKKFLQLQITSLRVLNKPKYSTQSATRRCVNGPLLTKPENVFIERGDRFKLLHNTPKAWFGVSSLGPLVEIDNINKVIKQQTEIHKKNLRKIDEIKESEIKNLHIPKYVRIKIKANKQFKGKRYFKKKTHTKPENEVRLQRKNVEGEYYWREKYYDMNLREDIKEFRQEFRRKLVRKSKPITIEKILHPRKQFTHEIKQNNDVLSCIDRDSQNNILNKIFYNTNDKQLRSNKYVDLKRTSIIFTNKEILLNTSGIQQNLLSSTAQKIRAMINPYDTDRPRIFNNNHYTYIYDKHLFDDIEEIPSKSVFFTQKRPEKRLQISDENAVNKKRKFKIFKLIKNNTNYLNMQSKSIHMQMNLPALSGIREVITVVEESNDWNLNNVIRTVKIFMGKLIKKNKKYIDRIRSFLRLHRSNYIDSFPKLTISDLSILKRKKTHDQRTNCHSYNIHPTGIINTRNDYFIEPSLDELISNVCVPNKTCFVENLTIGRTGYGMIEFLEPVDVYNLNIDKVLHFTRKNIDIYPNDIDKPPIGVGLNKKAKITLYEVWPTDTYSKQTITNENQLELLQFKTMLEAICTERNFKFGSYCAQSGCWVFYVDHF